MSKKEIKYITFDSLIQIIMNFFFIILFYYFMFWLFYEKIKSYSPNTRNHDYMRTSPFHNWIAENCLLPFYLSAYISVWGTTSQIIFDRTKFKYVVVVSGRIFPIENKECSTYNSFTWPCKRIKRYCSLSVLSIVRIFYWK